MSIKKKNIALNAILNAIRQSLSILFPLITYPYALRVLGVDNIGKVSYGQSIISYFSLLAMMGVVSYSIREGSKWKDNRIRFEEFASEVFTLNIIFTLISYILLGVTLLCVPKLEGYGKLLAIQSLMIIFTTLGIDWINTIYEDFLILCLKDRNSQEVK